MTKNGRRRMKLIYMQDTSSTQLATTHQNSIETHSKGKFQWELMCTHDRDEGRRGKKEEENKNFVNNIQCALKNVQLR